MEEDPYELITKKSLTPPHSQEKINRRAFAGEGEVFTSPSVDHPNFKWPSVTPDAPVADVASPVDMGKCSTNMQALTIKEDPYDFITKNSLIPPHIEEKLKRTPFAREGEVFTSPSYYHPNFKWPTVAPIPAAVAASPVDVGQCSTNMQAEVPKDINVIDISSSTDEEEEVVEYELIDVEDEEEEEEEGKEEGAGKEEFEESCRKQRQVQNETSNSQVL